MIKVIPMPRTAIYPAWLIKLLMFLEEMKMPSVVTEKIAMITKRAMNMPYSRMFCDNILRTFWKNVIVISLSGS